MSLKKERKFAQLRSGCQCLNRDIMQEIVSKRKDITNSVSGLFNLCVYLINGLFNLFISLSLLFFINKFFMS